MIPKTLSNHFKLLLLIGLIAPLNSIGQYKFQVRVKDAVGETLQLRLIYGTSSKSYKIKDQKIDRKDQLVVFDQSVSVIGAGYQLAFENQKEKIEILLDNNYNFSLEIPGRNVEQATTNARLTSGFLEYQKKETSKERKQELLNLWLSLPESNLFHLFGLIEKKVDQKYAGTDEEIGQFFKDVPKTSRSLQFLPNTYSLLFKIVRIKNVNPDNYITAADEIMKDVPPNSPLYEFYLGWMFKNLEYFQNLDLVDPYLYIYENYILNKNITFADKEEFKRIEEKVASLNNLPVGSNAPKLEIENAYGTRFVLSDLVKNSKYTIVGFFDPDCHHCQVKMPEVDILLRQAPYKDLDIQKILVLNSSVTDQRWEDFIYKYQMGAWLNVKPMGNEYLNDWYVYSNPKFFILNSEGEILHKNAAKLQFDTLLKDQ
jgi:thiol-disulfide isomerase/thioredoxin